MYPLTITLHVEDQTVKVDCWCVSNGTYLFLPKFPGILTKHGAHLFGRWFAPARLKNNNHYIVTHDDFGTWHINALNGQANKIVEFQCLEPNNRPIR